MADSVGRPLKFKSVKELQEKIDAYFAECDPHWVDAERLSLPKTTTIRNGKEVISYDTNADKVIEIYKAWSKQIPYTITGLALALDTTRETLLDYEDKEQYSYTVKRAKLKCQNYTELRLYEPNAVGPIFSLKNNYNWKDKTEVDNNISGELQTGIVDANLAANFQEFLNQQTKE